MIIFLGTDHARKLYQPLIKASSDDSPDIVVSCQYPYRIPKSLIDSHTCVNIHYGKLPEYAGCNPIYWQILEDTSAGVTLHYVDEGFDSGDIIDTYELPIGNMTADELFEALAKAGLGLFRKHYNAIRNGTAPRKQQDKQFRRYRNKHDVDFKRESRVTIGEVRKLRAVHFEGKQYPQIRLGGRDYEVRRCLSSL